MCYEWRWTVSRNRVLSPENTACVAVADGGQFLSVRNMEQMVDVQKS